MNKHVFKANNTTSQLESGQQIKGILLLLETPKTFPIPCPSQTYLLLIVYQKYVWQMQQIRKLQEIKLKLYKNLKSIKCWRTSQKKHNFYLQFKNQGFKKFTWYGNA